MRKINWKRKIKKSQYWQISAAAILFVAAFFVGQLGGRIQKKLLTSEKAAKTSVEGILQGSLDQALEEQRQSVKNAALIKTATEGSWGLSFQEEGEKPVANATYEELSQYDAWYAQDTEEKIIYLTFDCGYENGNTPAILEALKKHEVPATFFVVGNFLTDNPELAKQILTEGHTIGNHTMHHPDMSQIADLASFEKEIKDLEETCREITGQEVSKYYRPPQGKYSEANLQMAQQLGYQTFFWSLAYVDWYADEQPTKEQAFEKLIGRIHPGAIVLLHNTSATNGAILEELLTKWEAMGYTFGRLEDLKNSSKS